MRNILFAKKGAVRPTRHTAGHYLMKTKGLGHTTHSLQATGSAKQELSKDDQYSLNSHIIYIRNTFAN